MSDETKVPSIPAVSPTNLKEVVGAVKMILDTREGKIGDPLDANMTFRDLVKAGVVVSTPNVPRSSPPVLPVWVDPDGYDPTTDLTPPPRPEGFTATGAFATVILQWTRPAIRNLAYTEIWRSDTNVLGNAIRVATSDTEFYVDNLGTSATRFYWIRFVTKANVIGPYNATNGTQATTATDPGLVLDSLTGQITESELYGDLSDRIDLIDAPASTVGSVAYRLAQEATFRQLSINSAISLEAANRSTAIANEANARIAAITAEAITRYDQVSVLQTQIDTLVAASSGDFQDFIAVINAEQTARIESDTAITESVYALISKAGENTSSILVEQSTRASADATQATQLTSLIAGFGSNQAALVNEQTVRATSDSSTASQLLGLTSSLGSSNSALSVEQTTRATADGALTNQVTSLAAQAGSSSSALQVEQATRSSQDTALSSQVTSLVSVLGSNGAALTVEQTARATQDSALSSQITSLTASTAGNAAALSAEQLARTSDTQSLAAQNTSLSALFGVNNAGIIAEQSARASQDQAITTVVTGLSSSVGVANAAISQELTTRTTSDLALSSQLTNLGASFGNNAAAILAETNARAAADSVNASAISTVQSRLDTGDFASVKTQASTSASAVSGLQAKYTVTTDVAGHVSGYGLASSANNGTAISRFGVRASEFFVAPPAVSSATAPTSGLYKGYVWFDTTAQVTKYYNPDLPGWTTTPFSLPFVVKTSAETVNGVTAPAGVYIDAAYIRNGTITNAMIGTAAIDNAKIASLDAEKITTGTIDAARIDADEVAARIANIDAAIITSGTISSARIGDATITSAKIADTIRSTGFAGNKYGDFPTWQAEDSGLVSAVNGQLISGANGAPAGFQSIYYTLTGTAVNSGSYASVVAFPHASVTPGRRYEISCRIQYLNARVKLYIYWAYVNPANNVIEAISPELVTENYSTGGGGLGGLPVSYPISTSINQNINDFIKLGGFKTAPTSITNVSNGAVRACNAVLIYLSFTTHPSSSLFGPFPPTSTPGVSLYASQPYIAEVAATQTELNASYSYGSVGWEIKKDGSIVANSITARGDIQATSLSINSGVTSGARTTMTNEVIKVYDASGTLRVKIGNLNA